MILFAHKFFFSLLKVWLFDLDNHSKKLVFKTGLCHNKVDDCTLSSSFWLVMWVDELGLEIKFE